MLNDFDGAMRSRTDAELINILDGPPDDYQPLALESAKAEFKRRNLSKDQIDAVKQVIVQKNQIDEAKAGEPLPKVYKILSMIFPGVIQIMFAGTLKADGYERKYKELVRWTVYGCFFYVGLILLFIILDSLFRVL
jgi:hypothetical protein